MTCRALAPLLWLVPLLGCVGLLGCGNAAVPPPVREPELVFVPTQPPTSQLASDQLNGAPVVVYAAGSAESFDSAPEAAADGAEGSPSGEVLPGPSPASGEPSLTEQELGAEVAEASQAGEVDDTREDNPEKLSKFRQELSSSGAWVDDARYGTVWVPHPSVVGVGFVPYVSAGHWTLTPNHHWVWVSEHPFGPVVFHYGRWVWSASHGWVWIPGTRYGTAWVRFWHSGPYIGWAPLAPTYVWRHGVFVWVTSTPIEPCVFVHRRHVLTPYVPERSVRNSHHFRKLARSARPVQRPTAERAPLGRPVSGSPGAMSSSGAVSPGPAPPSALSSGAASPGGTAASPTLRRYRAAPPRAAHEIVEPVPKRRTHSTPSRAPAAAVVLPPRVLPGAAAHGPRPAEVLRPRRVDAAANGSKPKAKLPPPTAKPRVDLNKLLEAKRNNPSTQAPRRPPPRLTPPANKESLKYKGGFKQWTPPAKLRPAPARQAPRRPPPAVRRKR